MLSGRPPFESKTSSNFKISPALTALVIIICTIPVFLKLFSFNPYSQLTEIKDVSSGMIYFIIWLLFGIAAALITGALSFIDFIVKRALATPVIGGILLAVGLYEIFYLLYGITQPITYENTYFRWFISRIIHIVLLIAGAGYFSFVSHKKIRNSKNKNLKLLLLLSCSFVILGLAIAVTCLAASTQRFQQNGLITHPFELIILLAYLILGFYILPNYTSRFPSLFSRLLVISIIPAALATLFMAVHKQPFDYFFNSAYFLRLINYLIPLLGIGMNYIETSKKEKNVIRQMHSQIRERIQIQQKLKKREALLANAEKIAHLGSWGYDKQTDEVTWSDEMYEIFGLDINNYIPSASNWEDLILPANRKIIESEISNAIYHTGSYNVEFQIERPDQSIRCLLGQGYYSDADQKLISTVLDITELKEASFKLSRSEALLREAEQLSHNGSWEWSQAKNAFYWSDELYRIHGLEPNSGEIDLRTYLTLIHPDDVQNFVTILADTQTTLAPFTINYRIIRKNGEVRYLLLNGKFNKDFSGNVNQILGNTQDITELKNTSLLLERSESIYRTIARNVPDSAVFLFDKNFNLILSGGPAIVNIDLNSQISNAQTFSDIVFGNDSQSITLIDAALNGSENRLERKVNSKIFKITFTPVYLSDGEVFGAMIVMHDITDVKKAQQNLEMKVVELNRSNKDLEQFAYIASHDLQEPLRKIRAFGDRLKLKYSSALEEDGLDYINRMANASERMQLLIDDLLTFSRISRPSEELQPLSLANTINQVIQDLEYSIEKAKAKIEVNVSHNLKVIPLQLRQLLQNLCSNSLKFARQDQPLTISIHSETVKGENFNNLHDDKEYCKIEVRDNGIGFDAQYAGKIFILFHRLHSRNEFEGTGIGLAICKKIVENHNGIIEADGKENEGALFRIFLPIEQL